MENDLQEVKQSTKPFDITKIVDFGPVEPVDKKKDCGERGCHWIQEKSSYNKKGFYCDKPAMHKNLYCAAHMDMAEKRGMDMPVAVVDRPMPLRGGKLGDALEALVPKGCMGETKEVESPVEESEVDEEWNQGLGVSKKEEQIYVSGKSGMGMNFPSKELREKYKAETGISLHHDDDTECEGDDFDTKALDILKTESDHRLFEPIYLEIKIGVRKARIFID